jgi:hypothetical protein
MAKSTRVNCLQEVESWVFRIRRLLLQKAALGSEHALTSTANIASTRCGSAEVDFGLRGARTSSKMVPQAVATPPSVLLSAHVSCEPEHRDRLCRRLLIKAVSSYR